MSSRARLVGIALGFVLLVGAWIMSTAPFAGPDEQSHFVRALGLSEGVVLGKKVTYGDPGLSPPQEAFIDRDTREYRVPALLEPYDVGCRDGKPNVGSCLVASPNGNFPPLGYLLPAIALRFPDRVSSALWIARAGSAAEALIFLVLALALLWDGTTGSILGLLAAISPMVLFVASILNPSGVQNTSALAFAAAGLRIARAPSGVPRWVWVSLVLSGAVALLTGPIGLVFALADLLVAGALLWKGGLRELWRAGRRAVVLAAVVLAVSTLASVVYIRLAGFSGKVGFSPFGLALQVGWQQLIGVLRVAVGNFGAQTVPLPAGACDVWFGLVAGLVAAALWLGSARERTIVIAVTVLGLAFPVLYWAWIDRYTGFPILGREVMPVLLLIPLVAGEVVHRRLVAGELVDRPLVAGEVVDRPLVAGEVVRRPLVAGEVVRRRIVAGEVFHRRRAALEETTLEAPLSGGFASRRSARPVVAALALGIVSFQAYAFGYNEHLAPHDVTLLPNALFTPPLGWTPWTTLAVLGLLSLLAAIGGELLVTPGRVPLRRRR